MSEGIPEVFPGSAIKFHVFKSTWLIFRIRLEKDPVDNKYYQLLIVHNNKDKEIHRFKSRDGMYIEDFMANFHVDIVEDKSLPDEKWRAELRPVKLMDLSLSVVVRGNYYGEIKSLAISKVRLRIELFSKDNVQKIHVYGQLGVFRGDGLEILDDKDKDFEFTEDAPATGLLEGLQRLFYI